jgi:hypothetical protein
MADFELAFREGLRQIGAEALRIFLNSLQRTPESEMACACGGRLHYQRMRPAVTTTVFGKVEYSRAYYAGCACGEGLAPLDQSYGLEAGAISSGLAQLMALAGIAFSFEESGKWLTEFLLFEVSENSIRSETQQLGRVQQECEEQNIQTSQTLSCPRINEINPGISPVVIFGSRIPLSRRSRGTPMFLYLDGITFLIGIKIIVERDFYKVGVEEDQVILFREEGDITGSTIPVLFLIEPIVIAGRKQVVCA